MGTLFFVLLVIAFAGWLFFLFWKSPYTPSQTCVYFLSLLLNKFLWRVNVPKNLPVPPGQGCVLIANHRSSADPFFIQPAAKRVIHWLVAFNIKKKSFVASFLRFCQIVSVNRSGNDTAATKMAIKYAKNGETVGILPEGRINMSDDQFMMPVRPGAIMIALKARVPVVPMYIDGAPYNGGFLTPFTMPAQVTVKVGEAIDLSEYYDCASDKSALAEATLKCVREIGRLAGREDFEPEMAGRKWKPSDEELEHLNENLRKRNTGNR